MKQEPNDYLMMYPEGSQGVREALSMVIVFSPRVGTQTILNKNITQHSQEGKQRTSPGRI